MSVANIIETIIVLFLIGLILYKPKEQLEEQLVEISVTKQLTQEEKLHDAIQRAKGELIKIEAERSYDNYKYNNYKR
jgi:hypothetical protein